MSLLSQPKVLGEECSDPATSVAKPPSGEGQIRLGNVGGASGTPDHRHLGPGGGGGGWRGGEEQERAGQG